jgi:ankyrin repeat protein
MELGGDVNQTNAKGRTPLAMAAREGPLSLVRFLVEAGAHVNHAIPSSEIPLRSAIYRENLPVARYLIEAGAEVDAVEIDGDTAFLYSARDGCYSSILFCSSERVRNLRSRIAV